MGRAWKHWYHCNGNTYGTWLHGDPRGFREKKRRRHVEGDYRKPPPDGKYDRLHAHAKSIMAAPAVQLSEIQRELICRAMVTELLAKQIELLALSVDDHHFHLLGRFPDGRPRHWVGRAKYHASMILRGDKPHARLWASGCRAWPIRDRRHQRNAFDYIVSHGRRGTAVWTFRDPIPQCTRSPPHSRRNEP